METRMRSRVQPSTGLLLARAWCEAGAEPPLRARLIWTIGLEDEEHTEVVSTTADVLDVVERWLAALLGDAGDASGQGEDTVVDGVRRTSPISLTEAPLIHPGFDGGS